MHARPTQVGKKKAADVQFYTEVMDSVQTLEGGRRSMYDPDELEEEQREREMRNRVRPGGDTLPRPSGQPFVEVLLGAPAMCTWHGQEGAVHVCKVCDGCVAGSPIDTLLDPEVRTLHP